MGISRESLIVFGILIVFGTTRVTTPSVKPEERFAVSGRSLGCAPPFLLRQRQPGFSFWPTLAGCRLGVGV